MSWIFRDIQEYSTGKPWYLKVQGKKETILSYLQFEISSLFTDLTIALSFIRFLSFRWHRHYKGWIANDMRLMKKKLALNILCLINSFLTQILRELLQKLRTVINSHLTMPINTSQSVKIKRPRQLLGSSNQMHLTVQRSLVEHKHGCCYALWLFQALISWKPFRPHSM